MKEIEDEEQEKYETVVVKKAVAIKKRQLKKKQELEEIADDDTPIDQLRVNEVEVVKQVKKPVAKRVVPKKVQNVEFDEEVETYVPIRRIVEFL